MTSYSGPSRNELLVLIIQHNRSCKSSDAISIKLSQVERAVAESVYQHSKERRSKYNSVQLAAVELIKDLQKVEKVDSSAALENFDWEGTLKRCREAEVQLELARKHAEKSRSERRVKRSEEDARKKAEVVRRSAEAAKKKEEELRKTEEAARNLAEMAKKKVETIKKPELAKMLSRLFKKAETEPSGAILENVTRVEDNRKGKEKEIDKQGLKVPLAPRDRSRSPELVRTKQQHIGYIKTWAPEIGGNRVQMPDPASFGVAGEIKNDSRLDIPQTIYDNRGRSRLPKPIMDDSEEPLILSKTLRRPAPNSDVRKKTSDGDSTVQIGKITKSEKGRRLDVAHVVGLELASEVRKF